MIAAEVSDTMSAEMQKLRLMFERSETARTEECAEMQKTITLLTAEIDRHKADTPIPWTQVGNKKVKVKGGKNKGTKSKLKEYGRFTPLV